MRYEGKHNIGKCLANVVCNFKNIAKTVADRNQIRQCHSWYTGGVVQQPVVHHVHRESLQEAEGRAVLQQKFTSLSENDEIIVTRKVSVGGTEYRPGMTVIVGEMNAMPTFGQVKSMYCIGNNIYLFGTLWTTVGFDDHFYAYEVSAQFPEEYFLLQQEELKDYHPLQACSSYALHDEGCSYVVLRNAIVMSGYYLEVVFLHCRMMTFFSFSQRSLKIYGNI